MSNLVRDVAAVIMEPLVQEVAAYIAGETDTPPVVLLQIPTELRSRVELERAKRRPAPVE